MAVDRLIGFGPAGGLIGTGNGKAERNVRIIAAEADGFERRKRVKSKGAPAEKPAVSLTVRTEQLTAQPRHQYRPVRRKQDAMAGEERGRFHAVRFFSLKSVHISPF